MLEAILHDLKMVGMAMLLLAVSWAANSILGMYDSIKINNDSFDRDKFVTGGLKFLAVGFGTGLASVVISALPMFLDEFGIGISETATDTFSVITIAGLYSVAITKYMKQCIEKLTKILK